MLTVFCESAKTGVEQSVTIQGASNLNENEVDEMLAEAENMLLRIRKNVKLLI
jgi:hypothetical protein